MGIVLEKRCRVPRSDEERNPCAAVSVCKGLNGRRKFEEIANGSGFDKEDVGVRTIRVHK